MKNRIRYTNFGYRIHTVYEREGTTWLFLPGGPGLGSEYLEALCTSLKIAGSKMLVDFPKDGTNSEGALDLPEWREGLLSLVQEYDKPILVAHSFAAMFIQTLPALENYVGGLVYMNTTSTQSFFEHVQTSAQKYQLPDLLPAIAAFNAESNQVGFKKYWETYKHFCFTRDELEDGEKMLQQFAYNHSSYLFAINHFYMNFFSSWIPNKIPLLTVASENDAIGPPDIFLQDPRYQLSNILNTLIPNAGHVPWIKNLASIQDCFDKFFCLLES